MKIAAIIVTYNRLDKLKKTLLAYEDIENDMNYQIVVNNCSTDGTTEFLSQWEKESAGCKRVVVSLSDNLGGAGGFYEGCKTAMGHQVDWILLADDDAYPDKGLLIKFREYLSDNNTDSISAVCSSVYRIDDSIDYGHRKLLKYLFELRPQLIPSRRSDYNKPFFKIDLFSYVGVFLKVETLRKAGLCIPELFIYYDDMEHSMRIGKAGTIVCVPSMKFVHDDGYGIVKSHNGIIMSWRDYYDIRNKIYVFLKHKPAVGVFWTLSRLCMCFIKYPFNLRCKKLYLTAICHGIKGHLGKHPIYKPGFVIEK